MDKDKYVAYVSSYTWGNKSNFGIRIYDVDMENGRMTVRPIGGIFDDAD